MRVLVDQGKREEEGERNTTDENGEERGGAREMEIGYEMYWCFTSRKAVYSCWSCSKLCVRIGEKPTEGQRSR